MAPTPHAPATPTPPRPRSNNEVGAIQPVAAAAAAAREAHARMQAAGPSGRPAACGPALLVHCDAAQSVGKVRVDVQKVGQGYVRLACVG
jgi:cysteine sulfinate desulfinase/cysteine desulfurase-like protein